MRQEFHHNVGILDNVTIFTMSRNAVLYFLKCQICKIIWWMQTCVLKLQVLYDRPMISLQTSGPWESSVVYASILSNNLSSTPKWIEKISISLMPRWIDWLILQWKYFRKNRWWKEYNVDELIWFTIRNFIESYAIEYSHEVSFRNVIL